MEALQKLLSFVMFLVFIVSVVLLVRTFRKPRKVSVLALVISLITTILSLVFYMFFLKYQAALWVWILMAAIGLIIGIIWAKATRVYIQENRVMSKNSTGYLVLWGAVFALNQIITIITNRPPGIAMAMLIMSSAIVWGTNSNIISRYFKVKSGLGAAALATAPPPAPEVEQEETDMPQDETPATPSGHCPHCGAPVAEGVSFCRVCEKKI